MNDLRPKRLIIGLGSYHGDDQIGWKLAEALSHQADIPFRLAAIPADLLHWISDVDELYVCDACQCSGPPGTLHRWKYQSGVQPFDAAIAGIERLHSVNTHQVSLPATLSLARSLQLLPRHIVVWGIEGKSFLAGEPVSAELTALLPELASQLASELCHA